MLRAEITSQESKISAYEDELTKAQEELSRLQQETAELEHCIESGKAQLGPLQQHLQDSQQEINSVRQCERPKKKKKIFSWQPLVWFFLRGRRCFPFSLLFAHVCSCSHMCSVLVIVRIIRGWLKSLKMLHDFSPSFVNKKGLTCYTS